MAEYWSAKTRLALCQGLRAVFACSSQPAAGEFFERQGFVEVERGRVPASKWKGRKGALPKVYWKDL